MLMLALVIISSMHYSENDFDFDSMSESSTPLVKDLFSLSKFVYPQISCTKVERDIEGSYLLKLLSRDSKKFALFP